MSEPAKILVGLDESDESLDALALADLLAGPLAAELHVATVFWMDDRDEHRAECERRFARARSELEGRDFTSHAIRDVSAPKALHDLAVAERAELIVLGSGHRGAIGRILIGSVAERLLHGGPCAVAVPPRGFRGEAPSRLERIGVGYQPGEESRRALGFAAGLARPLGAELRLIGVLPEQPPYGSDAPEYLREAREPLAARYRGELERAAAGLEEGTPSEVTLAEGDPAERLVEESGRLDLLVLGSRGYGPVRATLLGAVSAEVMRGAGCPVIVVPRGAREPKDAVGGSPGGRPERIMAGFDGSDQGRDALRLARALSGESARLAVANVYEAESVFDDPDLAPPETDDKREAETSRVFAEADRELGSDTYRRLELWGSPARELNAAAEAEGIDLVVLGSTHLGPVGQVLPGSVGTRMFHGAPCAVAIAPRGYAEREPAEIRTITVGYDGSPESKIALKSAVAMARELKSSVRLVGVLPQFNPLVPVPGTVPAGNYQEILREDLRTALAAAAEQAEGVEVSSTLIDGDPLTVLIEQGNDADLMVVGSRGYGPLRCALLGSVSEGLVRGASCPVVVVPRGAGPGD